MREEAVLIDHHHPSSLDFRFYTNRKMALTEKPIISPVPDVWFPSLAILLLTFGFVFSATFFIYEATSSKRNRCLATELITGAVASIFLGFGSLFLLLATGVYV